MLKLSLLILCSVTLTGCATSELTPLEEQQKRAELIERCRQLKKDMVELKGKPLRRNASTQAFNAECGLRTDPDYQY